MHHFDWQKAKTKYLSCEQLSYKDIADEFGMSITAIKAYQKNQCENWQQLRKETVRNVAQRLPNMLGEELAQIQARHARIGKLLQDKGLEAIESGQVAIKYARDAREFLVDGVAMERKAVGLDTIAKSQGLSVNVSMSITDLADRILKRTQKDQEPLSTN